MRLYADLDSQQLIENAGNRNAVRSLTLRRSPSLPIEVFFASAGALTDPGAPEIFFVLKTEDKYDQDPPVLLNGSFTKSGTGSSAQWTATLNLVTTAIDALLVVDGDDTNDLAEITLMGELVWVIGGEQGSSGRLAVTITNNIYRGDETPVEETAAPGTYLTSGDAEIPRVLTTYTALTGGTSTDLDSLVTIGLPVGRLVILPNVTIGASVVSKQWVLVAGTDAEAPSSGIIRPDDYATSTNEKVWKAV